MTHRTAIQILIRCAEAQSNGSEVERVREISEAVRVVKAMMVAPVLRIDAAAGKEIEGVLMGGDIQYHLPHPHKCPHCAKECEGHL